MSAITLSVVIPAYNEAAFIGTLLERIRAVDLAPVDATAELIVVDDGSADDTADIAERHAGVRVIRQRPNAGKGAAVRAGIAAATGTHVLIQDADLEYDPQDYLPMLRALRAGSDRTVVYGSRYLPHPDASALRNLFARPWPGQSWAAYGGGRSLSVAAWLTTGRYLTDTVTAYKLFPRPLVAGLDLQTTGFELDHEISAKVIARGYRIVEVPIGYTPRSKAEGKKIGLHDWWRALRTFWRFRRG
jgi:glycosyltransferase involved in cell wall biosynthesis